MGLSLKFDFHTALQQHGKQHWLSLVVILGLPFFALAFIKGNLLQLEAGALDPFVYTGYIHSYDDLVERYGPTYYGSRIAFIFPARFFNWLFGDLAGYEVYRYLTLVAGVATVFGIAYKYFSFSIGIFIAIFFAFNPWVLRSLLSDHYDGVAATYLLVGMGFLVIEARSLTSKSLFAGVMFALATNTNTFTFGVAGAFTLPWMIMHLGLGLRAVALKIFFICGGFVGTYIAMGSLMALFYPSYGFFFERTAFGMARWMLEGGAGNWFIDFSGILAPGLDQRLYPVALLAGAIMLGAITRMKLQNKILFISFVVYLFSLMILYSILHFLFKASVFSYQYYIIYLLPGSFLVLIFIIGELALLAGAKKNKIILLCAGVHLSLWFTGYQIPGIFGVHDFYDYSAAFLMLIPLGVALSHVRPGLALASVAIISSSGFLVVIDYNGMKMLQNGTVQTINRDVYDGARFLQKTVDRLGSARSGLLRFWYTGEPGDKTIHLNSIQSTFLWGYSMAHKSGSAGMPEVDNFFRERISGARYLVLLGIDEEQISNGFAAMKENDISFTSLFTDDFEGKSWGYKVSVVELSPPQRKVGSFLFNVSLDQLKATSGGNIKRASEGIILTTPFSAWNYSAITKLRPYGFAQTSGSVVVRVGLQVEDGFIGIAVSGSGNQSNILYEKVIGPSSRNRFAYIAVDEISDVEFLIFRNGMSPGNTRAKFFSIDVFSPFASQ